MSPPLPPGDGLRFAFGTLTVLRVRVTRWDRPAARAGMLWAPAVGLVVGGAAAALGAAVLELDGGPLLAAAAAVAVPAVLTRGLHLDGLADTADGLGSNRPAPQALRVMKASDIGPFGVLALLFAVLAQVAATARLYESGWAAGSAGVVLAAITARLALTAACRTGVPAARPDGLGAAVCANVPVPAVAALTAGVLAAGAAGGAVLAGPGWAGRAVLAVLAGLAAAELLLRRCRRRFGGVTGDVLGALAETAATAAVVAVVLS
ncbi:adenosylcobinamide-GDP ribazoletransferase [Streptomyces capparidis]